MFTVMKERIMWIFFNTMEVQRNKLYQALASQATLVSKITSLSVLVFSLDLLTINNYRILPFLSRNTYTL